MALYFSDEANTAPLPWHLWWRLKYRVADSNRELVSMGNACNQSENSRAKELTQPYEENLE